METVSLIFLGIIAGISGGLFGIGGGVIIVPALVLLFAFDQKKAQGTSLVALLAPVGLFGLMNYSKEGKADLVKGAWIALGFLAGAFLGSRFALGLDQLMMKRLFGSFLVAVGLFMLVRP